MTTYRELVLGASASTDDDRELYRTVQPRLKALLLFLGGLHLFGLVINLVGPMVFEWSAACAAVSSWTHLAGLVATILFLHVLRRHSLPTQRLYDLLLGYEVLTCYGIAHAWQYQPSGGLSAVPIMIILFPLFVPTSPVRTLVASLLSATTVPIAHFVFQLTATSPPTGDSNWVVESAFTYIFALMAVVPCGIVSKMVRELNAAKRLGSYQLKEKIGDGGMGDVWKAEHRLLRRPAAIKLIKPDVAGTKDPNEARRAIDRFEREAQAVAMLESPHTVSLYDFGIAADGTFYHVMELLRGIDLEALVRRFGPISSDRAVRLLLQVCDSLDDAHRAGLIHRDIKPANIFLTQRGRRHDFVKVLDFGLAKWHSPDGTTNSLSTKQNEIAGTPAYMAPEVVMGEEVDARADLYALGCVAYFLVTGSLVFEEQTAMGAAIAHSTKEPVPPSRRAELPIRPELEAIIMSCLQKDPDARPQSALELAERLESIAGSELDAVEAERWWSAHLPELMRSDRSSLAPSTRDRKLGASDSVPAPTAERAA